MSGEQDVTRFLRWYAGPWGLLAHWLVMPWLWAIIAGVAYLGLPAPLNWLVVIPVCYFALTWQPWRAARNRYLRRTSGK